MGNQEERDYEHSQEILAEMAGKVAVPIPLLCPNCGERYVMIVRLKPGLKFTKQELRELQKNRKCPGCLTKLKLET